MDGMEQPVATPLARRYAVIQPSPPIEGDFGEGAFGPTILLRPPTHAAATYLRELFDWLATESGGTMLNLVGHPGFSLAAAIWSFKVGVREADTSRRRTRGRRLFRDADGGFTWLGDSEEWTTTALLVDPLIRDSGFQYLTDETLDDAIVEVSRGEY